MIRKEGIEKAWNVYRRHEDDFGTSYLNFGRKPLWGYINYCYSQYKVSCNNCWEKAMLKQDWLNQEIQEAGSDI